MIWWVENLERFRLERAAIDALAGRQGWLTVLKWRADDEHRLILDADIQLDAGSRPVSLRYPNHFPFSPPLVIPRGETERWSNHQYGPGGELCLEYGADNWDQSITGAAMIQSAHKLLSQEGASPTAGTGEVASRHSLTLGQTLRGSIRRFILSEVASQHLLPWPVGAVMKGEVNVRYQPNTVTFGTRSWGDPAWKDPSAPDSLWWDSFSRPATYARIDAQGFWPRTDSLANFWADLACTTSIEPSDGRIFLLRRGYHFMAFEVLDGQLRRIDLLFTSVDNRRRGSDHDGLADRKVGIVGCGSLGSKVAVSLARSGVGKFLLVDDDIMLPENMVRHELDWRDVGSHKAESVSRRIDLVNPYADVSVRQHRLGGQESSGGVESLVEALAECDLLIDASATPEVFNYLSASAFIGGKPMIWAEVYAGGIGGLVARHRPGIEPQPAMMRRAIENWCADQGLPIERDTAGYETGSSAAPIVADDADVSVIAAHATRFAIDQLIPRNPSIFPYAAYFIGLAPGWLFSQPFETRPVEIDLPAPEAPSAGLSEAEAHAERTQAIEILLGGRDGASAS